MLLQGFAGKMSGALISNLRIGSGADSQIAPVGLQGYIQASDATGWPPGEVDLSISGNPFRGYTLAGIVRSNEPCPARQPIDPVVRGFLDRFSGGTPARWAVQVTLQKQ